VLVEEGQIGVSDLFYPADRQPALALVHLLNGDSAEAKQMRD
jgi:hypothetical protein